MRVEIWSDVVCPWCYIGKRRFEAALERFEGRDDVEVVWRSFELAPGAPPVREGRMADHLARKYGMTSEMAEASVANLTAQAASEGLEFRMDIARGGNTFDAHRLIHLAGERGIQGAVKERFLRAHFTEGEAVGDRDTLAKLAIDAGLDPTEVEAVLDGDAYAADVRADEEEARELDITAVPTFVINRSVAIPGAQDPELILRVLRKQAGPAIMPANACDDDSCSF